MSLHEEQVSRLSAMLLEAMTGHNPLKAFSGEYPALSYDDAYSIQLKTIRARVQAGATVVGWKVGLTRRAAQDRMDLHEPIYGTILNDMVVREQATIQMGGLLAPKIEAEIAFFLGEDLEGPGVNAGRVIKATAGVMPAFDIVDSRFADPSVNLKDVISDNVAAAFIVLGGKLTPANDADLRYVGLAFEKNGTLLATAAGAEVLDNPAQSVAWLANKLHGHGLTLRKGQFVMSGSLVPGVEVAADSHFIATFDRLGSVSVRFK